MDEGGWLGLLYRWLLGACAGTLVVGVGAVVLLLAVLPLGEAERTTSAAMPWLVVGGAAVVAGPIVGLRVAGLRWVSAVAVTAVLVGLATALVRALA